MLQEREIRTVDRYNRHRQHKERKELHQLKREHERTEKRKRKVLKLQDEEMGTSSDEDRKSSKEGKDSVDIQASDEHGFHSGKVIGHFLMLNNYEILHYFKL